MRYLIALALLLCGTVGAVETGWTFGNSVSEDASGDSEAWTSPSNVLVDAGEASNQTGSARNACDWLIVTWSLSIPTDATIDGIQLRYTARSSSSNDMAELSLRVEIGGTRVGTDKATSVNYTTSAAAYSRGGTADLWGITPTATEANTIGIALQVLDDGSGSPDTVWIQKMEINITYTEAAGEGEGEGESAFFLFFNR